MRCPDCDSDQIIKNRFNAFDKQIYRCKACGRQFVLDPDKGPISNETKDLIGRLLLERISLAGIARVAGVSESWLQRYLSSPVRLYTLFLEQFGAFFLPILQRLHGREVS